MTACPDRLHPKHLPNRRGFDHYYGPVNGALDCFTREREGAVDWFRNGKTVVEEGDTTDLLGQEAVRVIRSRDKASRYFSICRSALLTHRCKRPRS